MNASVFLSGLVFLAALGPLGCSPSSEGDAAAGSALEESSPTPPSPALAQYFHGTVVYSTLDGATSFGPPVASLVRRVADPAHDRVIEQVTQKGQTFVTIMKRQAGLVFSAQDAAGSFHGTLTYGDDALASWSYDIDVTTGTNPGHLGGTLPNDGGRITDGGLTIRKIYGGQTLISESYAPISEAQYDDALAALVP